MKRKHKILIAVLLTVFIVFGLLIYFNLGFIAMVKDGLTYSEDELIKMKEENDEQTKEVLNNLGIEKIRPLTNEEEEKLASGEISEKDAVDLILERKTLDDIKNTVSSETEKDKAPVKENESEKTTTVEKSGLTQAELDAINEQISSLVGKMYVLKSQFAASLKEVEAWVHAQYSTLSPDEKAPKFSSAEQAIGNEMFAKVGVLEKDCDAQVEAILAEIKTLLEKSGQDTALVSSIRSAYNNEKQITKSYYISKYR